MTMKNDQFHDMEEYLNQLGILHDDSNYTEDDIIRLENEYNIEFPEIYKLFVLRYGNLTFEKDVHYRPIEQSHWTDIDGLNSFGSFWGLEEGEDNLEGSIEQYTERIPDSIVPIADDGLGNLICIGVKGDYLGKIYFWDHENEITAKVMLNEKKYEGISVDDYWENVYLVAESFFDFVKSFEIVEENQESDIGSKIVSEKMSSDFISMMMAARAELEDKEKARKDKKKDK